MSVSWSRVATPPVSPFPGAAGSACERAGQPAVELADGAAGADGSGGTGLDLNCGFAHVAPNSGVTAELSRRSSMNRSTRGSDALSTNSWWPHDCSDTLVFSPGYGLSAM